MLAVFDGLASRSGLDRSGLLKAICRGAKVGFGEETQPAVKTKAMIDWMEVCTDAINHCENEDLTTSI